MRNCDFFRFWDSGPVRPNERKLRLRIGLGSLIAQARAIRVRSAWNAFFCFIYRLLLSHICLLPVHISFPFLRSSLCSCRRTLSTPSPRYLATWNRSKQIFSFAFARHALVACMYAGSISECPATGPTIIADTNPSEWSFPVQSPHTAPCLHWTPSSGTCGTRSHPHKYSQPPTLFFEPSPARRWIPAMPFHPIPNGREIAKILVSFIHPITYASKSCVDRELASPREPKSSSLHAPSIGSVQLGSFDQYTDPGGTIAAPYADRKKDLLFHILDTSTKTDLYRSTSPSFVWLDHRRYLLRSPRGPGDLGFSQRRRRFAWDFLI